MIEYCLYSQPYIHVYIDYTYIYTVAFFQNLQIQTISLWLILVLESANFTKLKLLFSSGLERDKEFFDGDGAALVWKPKFYHPGIHTIW